MKLPFSNARVVSENTDPKAYHGQAAKRGSHEFEMSRSELMNFASNPSRWIHGYRQDATEATEFGDLMDCLVTDNARFEKRFAVKPNTYKDAKTGEEKKWTRAANVCKAWEDERDGLTLVKNEDMQCANAAVARLLNDPALKEFLVCSRKQVMVTADYTDPATGLVVPIKILIDLVPDANHRDYGKSLGDFKTARDASPRKWTSEVWMRGYHVQAALYLDIYMAACPFEDRLEFRHVISENVSPYQPARRWVNSEMLREGRGTYLAALALYCQCLASNKWPSWDDQPRMIIDGWGEVSLQSWMVKNDTASKGISPEPQTSLTENDDQGIIP